LAHIFKLLLYPINFHVKKRWIKRRDHLGSGRDVARRTGAR